MLKPLRAFCILLCIHFTCELQAQDPFFSQFYANPVYLNPAYAGLEPGTQLTLNYRDQWFGAPGASSTPLQEGYRTMNITLNQQFPCLANIDRAGFGLAASFFQDQTGNAPFTTRGGSIAGSFEYGLIPAPLKSSKKGLTRLDGRIGMQIGYAQSTLPNGRFIYSYQLDPADGLLTDPSSVSLASGFYPSFNIGAMVRGGYNSGKHENGIFTFGVSLSNINEPEVSLEQGAGGASLPMRSTVHFGFTQKIVSMKGTKHYNPIYIAPQFRWDSQLDGRLNLYTAGAYILGRGYYTGLFYQFNTPNNPATNTGVAIGGRNASAFIFNFGVDARSLMDGGQRWYKRKTGWIIGLSYDLGLQGVGSASALGSFEINCRFILAERKKLKCATLGKNELYKGATCPVSF